VLSQRRDAVLLFVERCKRFMEQHPVQQDWESYYDLARRYIEAVEREFGSTKTEADA
jgi:hypothetical protein